MFVCLFLGLYVCLFVNVHKIWNFLIFELRFSFPLNNKNLHISSTVSPYYGTTYNVHVLYHAYCPLSFYVIRYFRDFKELFVSIGKLHLETEKKNGFVLLWVFRRITKCEQSRTFPFHIFYVLYLFFLIVETCPKIL